MTAPYRDMAAVVEDALKSVEHRGPFEKCPVCGKATVWEASPTYGNVSALTKARACRGKWRWWWPFGCKRKGLHLHQKCASCGATVTSLPLEAQS